MLAIGALGDDLLGDMVAAAMARHGVDTSGLSRKRGVQTSATILPIRANGERPALHVPGATSLLELADVDLDRVRRSRALLIGAPDALGPIVDDGLPQVAAAARAGRRARRRRRAAPGPPARPRAPRPAAGPDGLVRAQRRSAARASPAATTSATRSRTSWPWVRRAVAVTLGADGCLVASQDRGTPVHLPAIAVDVVDTTGCGDGFTAGLLAGLLLGATPLDAAWLGLACGSLVATGLGSDAGIENFGQVLDFLARAQPRRGRPDQGEDDMTDRELTRASAGP